MINLLNYIKISLTETQVFVVSKTSRNNVLRYNVVALFKNQEPLIIRDYDTPQEAVSHFQQIATMEQRKLVTSIGGWEKLTTALENCEV